MDWFERLKRMKQQSGLTTKEIAQQSGLPEPTLEKLFAGQTKDPKLNTIRTLVHFLGYTLDELAPGDIKKSPAPAEAETEEQTTDKVQILKDFDLLNVEGQQLALDYMDGLTYNPKYKKYSDSKELA